MKRVMVSLALLLVSGGGMANNHTENRQFIHEQLQLDRQRFQSLQTPEFLKQTRPVAPQEQSFLDAQAQQFRQSMQPGERPVNAALVFVSFSMPAEELKQRVKDAAQLNIPVVIRGMVNGDKTGHPPRSSGGSGCPAKIKEHTHRADAFALLSCPTPETGKSKFSPLPAFRYYLVNGICHIYKHNVNNIN